VRESVGGRRGVHIKRDSSRKKRNASEANITRERYTI